MNQTLASAVAENMAAWGFACLADMAIKGTCLLLIGLSVAAILRRRAAAEQHFAWITLFGLLLALPILSATLPSWQVLPSWIRLPIAEMPDETAFRQGQASSANAIASSGSMAHARPGIAKSSLESATSLDSDSEISMFDDEDVQNPPDAVSSIAQGFSCSPAIRLHVVRLWLFITALNILWLAVGAGRLARRQRRSLIVTEGVLFDQLTRLGAELGIRSCVRLLIGREGDIPMAWGIRRPRILLPPEAENWPASQLRAVLLHELGHVARKDPLAQLVVGLTKAVYWFHPLVWFAAERACFERERSCDDLVLSRGIAANHYARHLLDVISGGRLPIAGPAIAASIASTYKLEGRLRSILDLTHDRRPLTRCALSAAIVAGLAISLPLAMLQTADARKDDRTNSPQAQASQPDASSEPSARQEPVAKSPDKTGNRDNLLGWYELKSGSDSGKLIPVFKIGQTYYSIMRKGLEVPLKECPEGLLWDLKPSSMEGTIIGFDKKSGEYYLRLMDSVRGNIESDFVSGEKQTMTKIDKPPKLLDPTAEPPRGKDDFIGWYQPVYFPVSRFEIRKDGEKHRLAMQFMQPPGVWKTEGEDSRNKPVDLKPYPDRLGFILSESKTSRTGFIYNQALKRYELAMEDLKTKPSACARVPMARISPSPEGGPVSSSSPKADIGIPCWD